jgi:hypothetical protein
VERIARPPTNSVPLGKFLLCLSSFVYKLRPQGSCEDSLREGPEEAVMHTTVSVV